MNNVQKSEEHQFIFVMRDKNRKNCNQVNHKFRFNVVNSNIKDVSGHQMLPDGDKVNQNGDEPNRIENQKKLVKFVSHLGPNKHKWYAEELKLQSSCN